MKKLALIGVVLSSLTACTTGAEFVDKELVTTELVNTNVNNGNEIRYPIRDVIKSLYINGWEGKVALQNAKLFGVDELTMVASIEPIDTKKTSNAYVKFHGRDAIVLEHKQTTHTLYHHGITTSSTMYSELFIDVNDQRIIGSKTYNSPLKQPDSLTIEILYDTNPLPNTAKIGSQGIKSYGEVISYGKEKETASPSTQIVSTWSLTEAARDNATLCSSQKVMETTAEEITKSQPTIVINECYVIDQKGHILSHNDSLIMPSNTSQPMILLTPNE